MGRTLRLWFGFEETVTRKRYLVSGLVLALVKYAVEALVVQRHLGREFGLAEYLLPLGRFEALHSNAWRLGYVLWSLPFMWIGGSLSVRRALDAGIRPALGLVFFVPLVNYLMMAVLACLPAAPEVTAGRETRARLRTVAVAVLASTGIVALMTALSTLAFHTYGIALFAGTPAVVGFVAGWISTGRARAE